MRILKTHQLIEGNVFDNVVLETCCDDDVTRPRVRPISHFSADVWVWFPRALREEYPIGTRFRATVKVCQKHWSHNGLPKGPPYLYASNIGVIVQSIPDPGLRAKLRPGSVSGRAYYYIWKDIS